MAKTTLRRSETLTKRLENLQALVNDLERELPRGNGKGALTIIGGLKRELDAALRAAARRTI